MNAGTLAGAEVMPDAALFPPEWGAETMKRVPQDAMKPPDPGRTTPFLRWTLIKIGVYPDGSNS